jgi:nitrite reductase/ring-hydroxylating ferredoxin subunit/uncharacterized membrane protein
MSEGSGTEFIERQRWLEPVENNLQQAVASAFERTGEPGRKVKNFLHGVWLRHPLHPGITDIPLGSWTATAVLDLMEATGDVRCAQAADTVLKVGLAGSAGAAITGLTDWHATDGAARRVGVVHGLLNVTTAVLYTASLVQRKRGRRANGRTLAFVGYGISMVSAWLGGHLVFAKQIGVNHTAGEPLPEDWTPVMDESELEDGQLRRGVAHGVKVLLVKRGAEIRAIAEVCSHLGGPLAEGELQGDVVQCPWHGSRFSLRDGSVVDGPATHPQPCFEARARNGKIEVRARIAAEMEFAGSEGMEDQPLHR